MNDITPKMKSEVLELLKKQKKANLSWVATITQIPIEQLKIIAWELGLVIEGDQILLMSETKEGKVEAKIQENIKKIIDEALNERVHRSFDTFITSRSSLTELGRRMMRWSAGVNPVDPHSTKTETNVSTIYLKLDGTFETSYSKTTDMKPIKDILYKEMLKESNGNIHYYIPLLSYYQLIKIPKYENDLTQQNIQEIESVIKQFDHEFATMSASFVNDLLIKEKKKGFMGIGKKFQIMTRQGLIECSGMDVEFYRYSLFLYTRTELNKMYYESIASKKFTCIIEYLLEGKKNYPFIDTKEFMKHIQWI